MDVTLSALCDFASVTAEGKLNILGVFNQVLAPAFPFNVPHMYLVIAYSAAPAEVGHERTARIVFNDADGHELLGLDQQILVPGPVRAGVRSQINQILGMGGIRLPHAGDYQFSILVDGDEKATVSMYASEAPPTDNQEGGE